LRSNTEVPAAARDEAALGYEWLRRPRRLLALCDVFAAAFALLALLALSNWRPMADPSAARTADLGVGFILVLTLVLGFRNGQYTNSRRLSRFADPASLATHLLVATATVALAAFVTRGFFMGSLDFSRLLVGSSLAIFFVLGASTRVALAMRQRSLFMSGAAFRKVLVLGDGHAAGEFIAFLAKRPWLGVACMGRLQYQRPDEEVEAPPGPKTPVRISSTFEGLERLDQAWIASGASEVVVALDAEDQALLPEVAKLLSVAHVPFRVVPSLFEESYQAAELLGYGELPVIDVDVDPLNRVERAFKRGLDLGVSSVLLVLGCLPCLTLVAAIKLDSSGPVFFKQPRVGKNGRHFLMYKFRTMVVNADALLGELADKNEKGADGQLFKIKADPRITRVGRFLRKWSLDELPQVINVYRGEMSLVGPRPPLPREVENYCSEHFCRLKGLPGMTGLWQVSGRSDLSFDEMVKLDRYYLDNWSVRLDLSIMLKTIVVVLGRRGAY
jgi:exopolysaccharide biosynthesis polyprenyl glycosylphosphotransferase